MSLDSPSPDSPSRKQVKFLVLATVAWIGLLLVLWLVMGGREERFNFGIFMGRFHILIVHMPIGLLAGALLIEAAATFPALRRFGEGVIPILWLSFLGAIAASLLGFILMQADNFTGKFVTFHLWTGLGVVALTALTLTFFLLEVRRFVCLLFLVATFVLTSVAGHFGGNMVHGETYLTEFAPAPIAPFLGHKKEEVAEEKLPLEDRPVYEYVIQPIFDVKCIDCHNEGKVKGDLRMDSYEWLAKGGDYGPSFEPGDAEASELYYRVTTDPDDDDFMPPEGKADPLTEDEIALLAWWINQGASPTMTIGEANPDDETLERLKAFFGDGEPGPVAAFISPGDLFEP